MSLPLVVPEILYAFIKCKEENVPLNISFQAENIAASFYSYTQPFFSVHSVFECLNICLTRSDVKYKALQTALFATALFGQIQMSFKANVSQLGSNFIFKHISKCTCGSVELLLGYFVSSCLF